MAIISIYSCIPIYIKVEMNEILLKSDDFGLSNTINSLITSSTNSQNRRGSEWWSYYVIFSSSIFVSCLYLMQYSLLKKKENIFKTIFQMDSFDRHQCVTMKTIQEVMKFLGMC